LDIAVNKNNSLIAKNELLKKWLMQNLLTGKKRLSGFHKVWRKCSANDFLSLRNEQAINDGKIPLFSLTIEDGVTEKSERYEREFLVKDKAIKKYKVVYPNDIVFNPANIRWGAIAKHKRDFKVLLSPIYEIIPVKAGYNIDFVSYLVSSPRQIAYYASIVEGTLIERMAVKAEPFLAIKYLIPEYEEQKAIAQVLKTADNENQLLKTKTERLREQKKGLMQVLLTGKKRLTI
jgi:type I restriction enzyme S subunit